MKKVRSIIKSKADLERARRAFLLGLKLLRESKKLRPRGSSLGSSVNYKYWDTPIEHYLKAQGDSNHNSNFNLEQELIEEIKNRKEVNRGAVTVAKPLVIFDIGAGSGAQWLDFIEKCENKHGFKHGVDFEVHVASLNRRNFHERYRNGDLKRFAREASAAGLLVHFKPRSFDVVTCNMGMHGMEMQGIRNTLALLRSGGKFYAFGKIPRVIPQIRFGHTVISRVESRVSGLTSIIIRKKEEGSEK